MVMPGSSAERRNIIVAMPDNSDRARLASMVESLPDFRVIATTGSLMETYAEVEERAPHAVLISARLASQPEYEVMHALFSTLDIRWLRVVERGPARFSTAGKPDRSDLFGVSVNADIDALADQLRSLTRNAIAPLTRRAGSRPPAPSASRSCGARKTVLIGASTGGVEALLKVLSAFGPQCPPTIILQHTGNGFGESLVNLLDRHLSPDVRLVTEETALETGLILVAAGTRRHAIIASGDPLRVGFGGTETVSGHCPSVDMLFQSAVDRRRDVVAALLTGMGRDGAAGMLALRRAGAHTIAQDAATSVVYGMPRAAAELGAAVEVLPLDRIGPSLLARAATDHARLEDRA